ncbi:glycosyltransferase family 4 protein [Candidatus Margulisiibacteriota bacterium]
MKIAILSPIAWRTPPRHYGPWESVASNIAEGLVRKGYDVTLFATADSITAGQLESVCPTPYEEDKSIDPKVWECLHISNLMEQADRFDIIHSNYDFLPLTYSSLIKTPLVTTIHGFTSKKILPVYKKYNKNTYYVSISDSDRSPDLDYAATVYNGINMDDFDFYGDHGKYLLFFSRMHPEKGPKQAIEIAKKFQMPLIMAGIIQDKEYFEKEVEPHIDGDFIKYIGSVGPDKRSKLLGEAYALLHPIYFKEPFGLSVAEAMACGTPVVAFNLGSMPELIQDKKTGFLVADVQSAVNALSEINDIDRTYCREWVANKFSIDNMIDGYLDVYRKVLGK